MATCMTWDDLQLPVHWTYSYLKEITVAISRTLTNLITSYYQARCVLEINNIMHFIVDKLSSEYWFICIKLS